MSYQIADLPLFSLESVSKAPKISTYDSLDDDVIKSYMEFSLASLLYYAMKEGACSEQSSRMTAMDNASKNAGMCLFLLLYNKYNAFLRTKVLMILLILQVR